MIFIIASAEAYLTPHVERYLESFTAGFKDKLHGVDVLFMQSDGGLTKMESFRGARAILSGPAGGVVGYILYLPHLLTKVLIFVFCCC